jgi:predicted GNAT superfamily acetyltransferase
VRWDLASDRVAAAADRTSAAPAAPETAGTVILRPDPSGGPATSRADGDALMAWIPEDIVKLRESDARAAHAWRRALRDTVGRSLSDGFRTESITRDGWFILTR